MTATHKKVISTLGLAYILFRLCQLLAAYPMLIVVKRNVTKKAISTVKKLFFAFQDSLQREAKIFSLIHIA